MKKIMLAFLLAVLALGVFAGVASAQTNQQDVGPLHEYMETALAERLGIDVAEIEAEFNAGKTLYQAALDHGIVKADLPALMLEVRTNAVKAALADGAITQLQSDRMLQAGGRGMGFGMRQGGYGIGFCDGTGIRMGAGMHFGGRWQQNNP